MTTVGVISDTHGLLRPEAAEELRGCGLIIHCGDVGTPAVLEELARIAPVRAVRGNNDRAAWAESLPQWDVIEIGERSLYVLHDLAELGLDPAAAGFAAVLAGHSHKPAVERRSGVLFVNPGSAGPRRFRLPIALARLIVDEHDCRAEIVPLLAEP